MALKSCSKRSVVTAKHYQQMKGFTLVELVIVIVLLGILAAAALPRFMDATEQAHDAVVEGVAGGFATAVSLVKAQWIADGNSIGNADIEVVMDGVSIFANENGWPSNTSGTSASLDNQTATECLEVWNAVMQNPPKATAAAIGNNDQYAVDVVNSNPDQCTYTLIINGALDPQPRMFSYDLATGAVTVDLNTP